jgi:hypothetical protein
MLRKTIHLAALGAITFGTLFAAGCASSNPKPYGLTGNTDLPSQAEQARWTDSKGHYHQEWRNGINTPAGYPK